MKGVRERAARAWLETLFWLTAHAPIIPRTLKPLALRLTWRCSRQVRESAMANARRILGEGSTLEARRRLGRRVLDACFEAVQDFGRNRRLTHEELIARIGLIEGLESYERARERGRGAILVTAHLGPFETALCSLMQRERRVHVVFRRDSMSVFERMRSEHRHRLGVHEAPIDEGLGVWFRLRDALLADEVVLLQGDRTMAGQRGVALPFLHGHVRIPEGPVKLAMLTGAPIIPTFAISTERKTVHIQLGDPIWVGGSEPGATTREDALRRVADVIAAVVARYREQWLVLEKAWVEDREETRV